MAWLHVDLRKHHRPRNVGRPPPQLAVDEVAESAEAQPQWNEWRHEIGDLEPVLVANARNHHAEKSTVKAHATLPQRQNFQRMRGVIAELVEQHVPEPAPENYAEHA